VKSVKSFIWKFLLLLVFWVLLFDVQRLVFSAIHYDVFEKAGISFPLIFIYSLRLDLATAGFLSAIPLFFVFLLKFYNHKWLRLLFYVVFGIEILTVSIIHSAEINAYFEWNHKLTSRVFMHLSNPDEVFRTADYAMTVYFSLFLIFESFVAFYLVKKLIPSCRFVQVAESWKERFSLVLLFPFLIGFCFLFARGGWQQIPINIDSACFSNEHKLNDVSINSTYFFGNSYFLYMKTDFSDILPKIEEKKADEIVQSLFNFNRNHDNYILNDSKPNLVFVILESWTANAIGCLSNTKGATPNFDKLAKQGVLFSNIYATNTTSEIGNTSILAGYPGIPEVAISLYPEKHRKIKSINQLLKPYGYFSSYTFAGDLKYGNIESFIVEHQFDKVLDEDDFPAGLEHGKLTYHDKDLFKFFLQEINASKSPFMQCAFTGSTHAPFDYPKTGKEKWKGTEADFMNSIQYSDKCIGDFIKKAKKEKWYKNTVFVFVADHSHGSPEFPEPYSTKFFRIPILIYGEPIIKSKRGSVYKNIGSQADLAATLLHQLRVKTDALKFSKDLLSPNVKQFAFHATIRGYGFIDPKGSLLYNFDSKSYTENTFTKTQFQKSKNQSEALFLEYFKNFDGLDKK
jgi:phosphoglycerol transferase MdoB-like AlkP superfamily enzyme